MDRQAIVARIIESGLVAVVRAENADEAARIAEACREGGAVAIEITFTVPGALKVIEALANRFSGGEILIGAGTVLDQETARAALLAGAQYIVSPHFDPTIVKLCHRYRVPAMPGTMSVTEIVHALESGADLIRCFPATSLARSSCARCAARCRTRCSPRPAALLWKMSRTGSTLARQRCR